MVIRRYLFRLFLSHSHTYLWKILILPRSPTQQPVLRLYAVPANAFTGEEEDEDAAFDGDDGDA